MKYKKYVLMLIVMNLSFFLLTIVFFGKKGVVGEYVTFLYFSEDDRFADFYNPAIYASDMQLVDNRFTNAPPFLHFLGYISSVIVGVINPGGIIDTSFRTSFLGYAFWLILVFIIAVLFCWQYKKLVDIRKGMMVGFFCIVLSYPFVYAVDRGNYVLLAAVFINLFIISYEADSRFSFLWLGIAASLKLYPALLGVIFIRDKKWKEAILSAFVFFSLTFLSLLFFSRGDYSFLETFFDWLSKVKDYSSFGNGFIIGLINNCSIKSFFMFFSYVIFNFSDYLGLVHFTSRLSVLINVAMVLLLLRCVFFKKNHDIYLMLSLIMVAFPIESGVYNLCLLLIPMLYWLYKENDKRIMFYSLFVFAGKVMVSLVNPVFLVLIIVRLLVLRKNEFCKECLVR